MVPFITSTVDPLFRYESLAWIPTAVAFIVMLCVGGQHLHPSSLPSYPAPAASAVISFASFVASGDISCCSMTPDYGVHHDPRASRYVQIRLKFLRSFQWSQLPDLHVYLPRSINFKRSSCLSILFEDTWFNQSAYRLPAISWVPHLQQRLLLCSHGIRASIMGIISAVLFPRFLRQPACLERFWLCFSRCLYLRLPPRRCTRLVRRSYN